MEIVDKMVLSDFLKEILDEAMSVVAPAQLSLCTEEELPLDVDARTQISNNGDHTVFVKPTALQNEYILSHELLHICARRHIPNLIRILQSDIVGMIGSELQGYLEHNWILAEQKRRGLEVNELELYANLRETIGQEQEGLERNIYRILMLNEILLSFPKVLEEYEDFLEENCPTSLAYAKRIMSAYAKQEIYSKYEARRATLQAIKVWNEIFQESNLASLDLKYLISVKPVFSEAQLKRISDVILHVIPKVILNQENQTSDHVLVTAVDGQCCVMFSMDDEELLGLQTYMRKVNLEEFLRIMRIDYLVR